MTALNNPAGHELILRFELITNLWQDQEQYRAQLTIVNRSAVALKAKWVIYFNSIRMINPDSVTNGFAINHLNGDFFTLFPQDKFKTIAPGAEETFAFCGPYWITKISDAPSGFYIVFLTTDGQELAPQSIPPVEIIPLQPTQIRRNKSDQWEFPSAEQDYANFSTLKKLATHELCPLLPTPVKWELTAGHFYFKENTGLYSHPVFSEEVNLWFELYHSAELPKFIQSSLPSSDILVEFSEEDVLENSGAYQLDITPKQIIIRSGNTAGIFYALQSLRQLIKKDAAGRYVPCVRVTDFPQFSYRGLHLDVARNFHPIHTVKKLLDLMAYFKLNKFHFHLTDDEGWRLEIPGLPELTNIGSKRGHTHQELNCLIPSLGSGWNAEDPASPGNGFFTRDEFIELLQFAHQRQIEVIPAIDLPGHARAAIKAMQARYLHYGSINDYSRANEYLLTDHQDQSVYSSVQMWTDNVVDVALPSTYHFIEKITDELAGMYAEAGLPLQIIHFGGDEVPSGAWTGSPACQGLLDSRHDLHSVHDLMGEFLNRLHKILAQRNIRLAGWEEICLNHRGKDISPDPQLVKNQHIPYFWNTTWGSGHEQRPYQAANLGYPVVLCNAPNLYLDFAYSPHPEERGYYWGGVNATQDVFRFLPLSLYRSAERDAWGQNIEAETYTKAPVLKEENKKNILGLQGQLWSETLTSQSRLEYMVLPRLCALAERAWAQTPLWSESARDFNHHFQEAWTEFANRLGQLILPLLDQLCGGFDYRLSPPGAQVLEHVLYANTEFPGLHIHYTFDGTEPSVESPRYEQPVKISASVKVVKLCTVSTTGRTSRIVALNLNGP